MEVEWLILADAAQVVGGKLYLMGGGWENVWVNALPTIHNFAVAAAFRVPWGETNQRHQVEVEVREDEGPVIAKVGGPLEVGRPPGLPGGMEQRVQFAVTLGMEIRQLGTFTIRARVNGEDGKVVSFRALAGPLFGMQLIGPSASANG